MKLSTREMVIFAMLGVIMYVSKIIMEFAPNVHLLGVFTVTFTVVYRQKALYPIYIYVLINGLLCGFSTWWLPYLYIWAILWGWTMLVPRKIKSKPLKAGIYMGVCAAHGFLFGTLYAPAQALLYHLTFKGMIAWIIAGLPWDAIHGISNLICGTLIMPLSMLLSKLEKHYSNGR